MSLTVRPPAVRSRVSCWKTFIVVAIVRESLPDAPVESQQPQWILQDERNGPAWIRTRDQRIMRSPGASRSLSVRLGTSRYFADSALLTAVRSRPVSVGLLATRLPPPAGGRNH